MKATPRSRGAAGHWPIFETNFSLGLFTELVLAERLELGKARAEVWREVEPGSRACW